MSEAMQNMLTRRSVRKYLPDPVPRDVVETVMRAGLYAANGRGSQSTVIIAVTEPMLRDELSAVNCRIGGWADHFDPFYGAPVVLIVLADKSRPTYVYDGACTMQNLLLAAHDCGLGSCWIHRAKETFEIPEWQAWLKTVGVNGDFEGIGFCILGTPDGPAPAAAPRREDRLILLP